MLCLLGGVAVFGGFPLLVHPFVNADPARLARGFKVTASSWRSRRWPPAPSANGSPPCLRRL
jgi:hypothetical protein